MLDPESRTTRRGVPSEPAVGRIGSTDRPSFELRPGSYGDRLLARPGILVIGASTGGPQALIALIAGLGPVLPSLPVCVTLHMPRDLMPVVAAHVARRCGVETKVVNAPAQVRTGMVCFAPGDRHLDFDRSPDGVEMRLSGMPTRTYCKPAVDAMFVGAARSYGARTVGVVLSGMGEDGLAGSRAIVASGGILLVQDKASSAVWGMPGAVAKAGLAAAVLSPAAIAAELVRRVQKRVRSP